MLGKPIRLASRSGDDSYDACAFIASSRALNITLQRGAEPVARRTHEFRRLKACL
jgi:hypothetical protein